MIFGEHELPSTPPIDKVTGYNRTGPTSTEDLHRHSLSPKQSGIRVGAIPVSGEIDKSVPGTAAAFEFPPLSGSEYYDNWMAENAGRGSIIDSGSMDLSEG